MKTLAAISTFLLSALAIQAQTALESSWITNGRVKHIATGDGKVLLVGEFNWFGPAYNGGTASFSNTLVEDESFPKIEEEVSTAILDDAGGWYVAIRDRRNQYESKIIHIHADKTIDELVSVGEATSIIALAKSGNILYFGGYFQSVNGIPRNAAAAIDLTNNTLTSWNPGVDANGYINALTVSGSTVYAGGAFSTIGGQTRTHIAALDATTGLATSWNVTVTGNTLAEVNCILVNAGIVYFGGYFDNVNASVPSRRHFAAVNAATATLETFNPRPDGRVRTMLLDGGMLYMAGGFDHVLGATRFRVARIELATSTLTPFELIFFSNTHSNFYGYDQVNAIGIDGNKLFIGGSFPTVNDEPQPHLGIVNKVTGVLEPSEKKIYAEEINTLLVNGGNIFVGGYIKGHLGTSVNGFAALDETTGAGLPEWTDQLPAPPEGEYYESFDFHYQEDRLYYYLNVSDGTTLLGALNADDGSVINTWAVTINHHIEAWAFSNDALYLADQGNDAMTINGQSRERFAAVDLETGALLPWTIDFPLALDEHYITSLALENDALYVAGAFIFSDNGVERNSFAAWSATTGSILPWSQQIDELDNSEGPTIGTIANSQIYLIGNGVVRRVHPVTGVADDWEPTQTNLEYVAINNNSVFLAGEFEPGLILVDGTTAEEVAWQPDFENIWESEGSIDAVAVAGSKLLMGGNFYYEIDGIERYGYAEYLLPNNTNSAPQIQEVVRSVPIQGIMSIYLPDIINDVDNNIDLTSAEITSSPESGATAYIDEQYLIIDYSQTPITGTDRLTLRVCDDDEACTEQEIVIEVGGDIEVYNAISANEDNLNRILYLQYIDILPDVAKNKVSIFNRWGDLVFDVTDYNNEDRVFKGVGKNGNDLPSGTYYYKIEFAGGRKTKTGYLSLKR